jgi:hypothetical protein
MLTINTPYQKQAIYRSAVAIIGLAFGLWALWGTEPALPKHRAVIGTWLLLALVSPLVSFALEDWYRAIERPQSRFGRFVKHSGLLSFTLTMFFMVNMIVFLLMAIMADHT